MDEVACPRECRGNYCKRVQHKDQVYRCAAALADKFKVSRGAVWQALSRHGSTDCLGQKRGGRGNYRKPVQVGPHKWPTIGAMAQELGLDRSHLGKMLRGDPERVLAYVMRVKG